MNLSLMQLMRDDPDFGRRIEKKTAEVKKDKENLNAFASKYSQKYAEEIREGTELRQKLLTEGRSQGKTDAEIIGSFGKFVPCVQTPILNSLFFMQRESEGDKHFGKKHYEQRDKLNEAIAQSAHGKITEKYENPRLNELTEAEAEAILNEFIDDKFAPRSSPVRQHLNSIFDDEKDTNEEGEHMMKDTEKMEEYLYGNLTLDQFDVLKKLKALAQSDNIAEATLAFKKCRELCSKYGLDFEKIPCNYKK